MKWRVHYLSDGFDCEKDFEFGNLQGLEDYLRLCWTAYVPGLFPMLGHFERLEKSVALYFEDDVAQFVIEVVRV